MGRIVSMLRSKQDSFGTFIPCPPAYDRAAWSAVDPVLAEELRTQADNVLAHPDTSFPHITASLYMDFCRTGNRIRFENAYFTRRISLNVCVLAECIVHDGRYLDAVIDGIMALCGESGWVLPAHNSPVRDAPQLPLPDTARPVLDLFACETGCQLAMICWLLEKELNEVSPAVCARIRQELQTRIFQPYLTSRFWWMGYDRQPTNNWTVWCTQNVLLASFIPGILGDGTDHRIQEIRRRIAARAAFSIDRFLSEYGQDGCCDEGAQYYRHAGLCLYNALEILREAGGASCADVFSSRQIKNIAEYIVNVHAAGTYYLNFADCAAVAGRAGVREYLFGRRCGSEPLMAFAADDWRARLASGRVHNYTSSDDALNLWYFVQELFTSAEVIAYRKTRTELQLDCAYPSTGLYITRDSVRCLGIKAGNNGDSHNHNDTGSFILYKNGLPFAIDAGVETYSRKTFSAHRYEIWTMQSVYHNITAFDDTMQQDGSAYRASCVRYVPGPERTSVSMRLEKAWPAESGIDLYRRTVTLEKERCVVVKDQVKGSFCMSYFTLMTAYKPVIAEAAQRGGLCFTIGGVGKVCFMSSGTMQWQILDIPVTDERLRQSWPDMLYRLRVSYTDHITAEFI